MQTDVNPPSFKQHLAAMAIYQLNIQQQLKNMGTPNNSIALS